MSFNLGNSIRDYYCSTFPSEWHLSFRIMLSYDSKGAPGGASGKKPTCQCKRHETFHSVPGLEWWLGEGNGNPLQYSCLENPMDTGAWQAIVTGVTKSWTQVKWLSMYLMVHIAYLHFWIFIWCNSCQAVLFLFSLIRFFFL